MIYMYVISMFYTVCKSHNSCSGMTAKKDFILSIRLCYNKPPLATRELKAVSRKKIFQTVAF